MKTFVAICFMLLLSSCGTTKFRTLENLHSSQNCFEENDRPTGTASLLEEKYSKIGLPKSKNMVLLSKTKMIEKTARLYVEDADHYVVVIHLIHSISFEIKYYEYRIVADSIIIDSGLLSVDSKTSIGEFTDEYVYTKVDKEDITKLSENKEVYFYIDGLQLEMPYACRETFRSTLRIRNPDTK